MKPPASDAELADYVSISSHPCPQCGAGLIRTPSRPADCLLNLLVSVQRYRCARFSCQWSGNIRVDFQAAASAPVYANAQMHFGQFPNINP